MEERAVLDAIKHSVDLRDVIQVEGSKPHAEYVQGLCPFHGDKNTPSFTIYRDHYYCYGCHVYGDIFTWFAQRSGGDFQRAVEEASQLAGVPLEPKHHEKLVAASKQRARMIEYVGDAQSTLWSSEDALAYLRNDRQLLDETILEFGLGYDEKEHAFIIPINDRSGNLLSYMKRNMRSEPKYWSQNSYWFRKGSSLYNAQAIGNSDTVHLVEGPFDVMTLAQVGVECPIGTGFGLATEQQISMLRDHCENVIFIPDCKSDNDWQLLKQNVERFRSHAPDLNLRVSFPPGLDVNECDPEALKVALEDTHSAEAAILDLVLKTGEQVDQYPRAREFVQSIPDALVRDDIIRALSLRWDKDRSLVSQALLAGDPSEKVPVTIPSAMDSLREEARLLTKLGIRLDWMGLSEYVKKSRAGHVIFILARTGVGKTMLALNLLRQTTGAFSQLFVSLEQSRMEIANRLTVMTSWNDGPPKPITEELLHHYLLEDNRLYELYREYMGTVYEHVRIEDSSLSLDELRAVMRNLAMNAQFPLRIVWLDYLGLVKEKGDTYERISHIATSMKDIAKEFGVLIVALVQLSRQAGSGRKAVALDMARDSGVIEEAADLIIGVHRPLELAEEETLQDVPMIADVLKNRHGRTGRVEWNFNKWSLRIEPKPFPEK